MSNVTTFLKANAFKRICRKACARMIFKRAFKDFLLERIIFEISKT
jgi:hypothetical protein